MIGLKKSELVAYIVIFIHLNVLVLLSNKIPDQTIASFRPDHCYLGFS
jgi:hypothetical protein